MKRSYTRYNDYRVYLPLEQEFERDALGAFIVHALISDADGNGERLIPIRDCVAPSLNRAWDLSMLHAMRAIDEAIAESRPGAPMAGGKDRRIA